MIAVPINKYSIKYKYIIYFERSLKKINNNKND